VGSVIRRYAIVRGARSGREVRAYLPDNYRLDGIAWETNDGEFKTATHDPGRAREIYIISGVDSAGWTLEKYVMPRFGSGNMGVEEVDLSHPVMKVVPPYIDPIETVQTVTLHDSGAYEISDPKHPDHHDIYADLADGRD
jgi:hypothetical protein